MVELKDKTVEELRKMASRKKIEGRSKMNKSELIRALKKKNLIKKKMKRRKMKGGALNNEQITELRTRDYVKNPMTLLYIGSNGEETEHTPITSVTITGDMIRFNGQGSSANISFFTISEDGTKLIGDFGFRRPVPVPEPATQVIMLNTFENLKKLNEIPVTRRERDSWGAEWKFLENAYFYEKGDTNRQMYMSNKVTVFSGIRKMKQVGEVFIIKMEGWDEKERELHPGHRNALVIKKVGNSSKRYCVIYNYKPGMEEEVLQRI